MISRYVLPAAMLSGFVALVVWSAWDLLFPPWPVKVVPVISTTADVRQEGTPLFQAAGWIEPRPTPVRVAALAPGVVEELLVVEDQAVRAGEPIAELVKDDARLSHDEALANLELRQAELDQARAILAAAETRLTQPVHLDAELGAANAALAKIQTQLQNLPYALRRAVSQHDALEKELATKQAAEGVVAGIQIDVYRNRVDAAQALIEELQGRSETLNHELLALKSQRDALQTQRDLLADELGARDAAQAMVKAAAARVAQAQVAARQAKLRLDRMTIVSPIDGRVFRLLAHPGTRVGMGQTTAEGYDSSTIVTLYKPEMLQVRVDVRFEDLPQVSLGQTVELDNPALAERIQGRVLFVSSEADIQKNTLQVKVEIPEPQPVFKPEMLVDVTFLAAPRNQSPDDTPRNLKLYLPAKVVLQDERGPYVWVADQSQGIARKVPIEIKLGKGTELAEVTTALPVSSRIIVDPPQDLRDGGRIVVVGDDTNLGTSPASLSEGNPIASSGDNP